MISNVIGDVYCILSISTGMMLGFRFVKKSAGFSIIFL